MTQQEDDKELGRIVRERLAKVVDRDLECEIDVVLEVGGRSIVARIRVAHAADIQ